MEVRQTFTATPMPERAAEYFKLPAGYPSLKIVRQYLDGWGRTFVLSFKFRILHNPCLV